MEKIVNLLFVLKSQEQENSSFKEENVNYEILWRISWLREQGMVIGEWFGFFFLILCVFELTNP